MATRSMIWVKINSEDFGKTMMTDTSKLPMLDFNYPCVEYTIPIPKEGNELWLGIYCHWDGYPEGVGAKLLQSYNTYETILNLVLLGDCSSIVNDVISYHNWRNEDHNIRVEYGHPKGNTGIDYTYYFDNGKWSYSEWNFNNKVIL